MFWNTSFFVTPDKRPRAQLGGVVHVLAREKERLGLAGGAARRVQTKGVVQGNRQQAGGIIGAQVGAGGERQSAQVVKRVDVPGPAAQFGELLAIERHVRGHAADGFLQALKLQLLQRGAIERFDFLVPKHD